MWLLHQKATRFHRPPSELVGIEDEWAAYQFDNAVNFFGVTVENALQERDEIGMGTDVKYRERYTLAQLLEPNFRLPRPAAGKPGRGGSPAHSAQAGSGLATILSLAGQPRSGVKKFVYVGPPAGAQ